MKIELDKYDIVEEDYNIPFEALTINNFMLTITMIYRCTEIKFVDGDFVKWFKNRNESPDKLNAALAAKI